MSLKLRLVGIFIGALIPALFGTVIAIVLNARQAVETEVEAGMELAAALVRHTIAGARDPAAAVAQIRSDLAPMPVRHVRIGIGDEPPPRPPTNVVPSWFVALVAPPPRQIRLDIPQADAGTVTAVVTAVPGDEIAEIWTDSLDLFSISGGLFLLVSVAVGLAAGRALRPLDDLSRGLEGLKRHDYRTRLPVMAVSELTQIAVTFNALADSLAQAEAENRRLGRQIIAAQDLERRQVATEIHDELGPCLFGIRVEAHSILHLTRTTAPLDPEAVAARARSVIDLTDSVQKLSRTVLERLRPMALAALPLTAVLTDMVERWSHHLPATRWRLTLPPRHGERLNQIDDSAAVTLYRVLQESLMNCARHADATEVSAEIGWGETADGLTTITFRIADNGRGVATGTPVGIGLRGMRDRVQALGGTLSLGPGEAGAGWVVRGEIPITFGDDTPNDPPGQRHADA